MNSNADRKHLTLKIDNCENRFTDSLIKVGFLFFLPFFFSACGFVNAEILFGSSKISDIISNDGDDTDGDDTGVVADMPSPTFLHSLVRLNDGRLLSIGGETDEGLGKYILYDPGTDQWSEGPAMLKPRYFHSSTVLNDGKVLVVGGTQERDEISDSEIFFPQTGSVIEAALLPIPNMWFGMATLKNGKALAIGGYSQVVPEVILKSVYVYDPGLNTWNVGVPLTVARAMISAVTLKDGRVFVAGGLGDEEQALSSAEIFNPDTNSWSLVEPMPQAMYSTTPVLLKDGRIMVFGTYQGDEGMIGRIQIYNPQTNSWTSNQFDSNLAAGYPAIASLADGRVVITGGTYKEGYSTNYLSRVATYSPSLDLWRPIIRKMTEGRVLLASTLLNDGRVFIMGGMSAGGVYVGNPEIYDVASNTWTPAAPNGTLTIIWHSLATLPDGRVLLTGGFDVNNHSRTFDIAEVYNPTANSWSIVAPMNAPRLNHASVTLDDGRVLVIGGTSSPSDTAEAYDPATNTWSYVADLGIRRPEKYDATKLKDGRVLVLADSTVLMYDPIQDTWTPKSSMAIAPDRNQAVLSALPDGRAFVTTGLIDGNSTTTSTSEIYDPETDTWTTAASLNNPKLLQGKAGASGVTLLDGRVLVLGGMYGANKIDSDIKIYNSVTDTWE